MAIAKSTTGAKLIRASLQRIPGPLLKAIHKAASIGWIYDTVQFLAGARITRARLREYLKDCTGRVLDLGGGTGSVGELLPAGCSYTCLDNEMPKLQRCEEKLPGSSLLADATRLPIHADTLDAVTCVFVTHHLTSDQIGVVLSEAAQVLKTG